MQVAKWTPESEAFFKELTIGERVRWLLEVMEMTQTELAERSGGTQAMVSNIVNDKSRKPSAPTLLRMAEAMGCEPAWILYGAGNPFVQKVAVSAAELKLLSAFRAMASSHQTALVGLAGAMGARN